MIKPRKEDDGLTLVETDDDDFVLEDGEKTRVRLALRDGDAVEEDSRRRSLRDARRFGLQDPFALNKPGFRFLRDRAALERLDQAYRQHDEAEQNRWRTAPTSHDVVKVGRNQSLSVEDAYALTDWEAENAWRGPEWLASNRPQFSRPG